MPLRRPSEVTTLAIRHLLEITQDVTARVFRVLADLAARLRHQRIFSLAKLNAAIADLVQDLNAKPMRKLGLSRRQLFEQLYQSALSSNGANSNRSIAAAIPSPKPLAFLGPQTSGFGIRATNGCRLRVSECGSILTDVLSKQSVDFTQQIV
jgi:hypothetical protein